MKLALPKAVILGCESTRLSEREREFFHDVQPAGFILFARNCEAPQQVAALVAEMKATVKHPHVPVLIDQEGGRVARLKPPYWISYPPAGLFAEMAKTDLAKAERCCYLNARMIAHDLSSLGINTNCAPVADLRVEGAHDIIGDRAFGYTAEEIVPLARAQAKGLMDGGVLPVLKHIPGHGRAKADSHIELPVVREEMATLKATDFRPFEQLSDLPMGMTAHVCYTAIDPNLPLTLSDTGISMVRELLGFDGFLMSDDISMKALKGDLAVLTKRSLEAGCDVVLHCNGEMEEMMKVVAGASSLSPKAMVRLKRAFHAIRGVETQDIAAIKDELLEHLPETYQV